MSRRMNRNEDRHSNGTQYTKTILAQELQWNKPGGGGVKGQQQETIEVQDYVCDFYLVCFPSL